MMTRRMLPLAGLLLVAGCGRMGPVVPPGPPDRITYPRAYPRQPRPEPRPAAETAPPAADEAPPPRR